MIHVNRDVESGVCSTVLAGHTDEIFSCAFNYDGDTIITGSKDNTCRIWKADTGANDTKADTGAGVTKPSPSPTSSSSGASAEAKVPSSSPTASNSNGVVGQSRPSSSAGGRPSSAALQGLSGEVHAPTSTSRKAGMPKSKPLT
jgi:WD40 repeat protein